MDNVPSTEERHRRHRNLGSRFWKSTLLLILVLGTTILASHYLLVPFIKFIGGPPTPKAIDLLPENYRFDFEHKVTNLCPGEGDPVEKFSRDAFRVGNVAGREFSSEFGKWRESAKRKLIAQRLAKGAPPLTANVEEELTAGFYYRLNYSINLLFLKQEKCSRVSNETKKYFVNTANQAIRKRWEEKVTELLKEIRKDNLMDSAAAAADLDLDIFSNDNDYGDEESNFTSSFKSDDDDEEVTEIPGINGFGKDGEDNTDAADILTNTTTGSDTAFEKETSSDIFFKEAAEDLQ